MGTDAEEKDGAAVRVPPPLVYLAAVLAGVALNGLVWPLSTGLSRAPGIALALLLGLPGVLLAASALQLFRSTGQDPKPWVSTPEIVRTGIYRFTRNPMYLGMVLLQTAIGVGLGNLWVVLLAPVSCIVVQITAIRHEEAYLEGKFGEAYLEYKRSVRRWL